MNIREKLAQDDPAVFAVIDETYGKNPWRSVRDHARKKK